MDSTYTGPERRRPDPAHAAAIQDAVAAGIRAAVSDPATWDAASAAMRSHAQSAAGGWLLGGLGAALNRLMWIGAAALALYMVGGWSALARWIHGGSAT